MHLIAWYINGELEDKACLRRFPLANAMKIPKNKDTKTYFKEWQKIICT